MGKRTVAALLAGLMVLSVSGCGGLSGGKGPIVVGSKIDTEGSLLGQIIIAMLEKNGFKTVDKTQTGPTSVVRQALLSSQIDIYPEYTGTAFSTFFPTLTLDPATAHDATKVFDMVKVLDMKNNNVIWLGRAPADNTFAIAVPEAFAKNNNVYSLPEWAAYIKKGGNVKFATSAEFLNRPDGFPAYAKAYGITLKPSQEIVLSGGNTAVFEKAVAAGTSGANAALAYGTDGGLSALGLVALTDPKGVQPYYQPAPIVRAAVASKYPELASILDPVFAGLDLKTLQTLNAKISLQGQSASSVARAYLKEKGFLK
jgi:osmoprotectant transport system substrate-binding protein